MKKNFKNNLDLFEELNKENDFKELVERAYQSEFNSLQKTEDQLKSIAFKIAKKAAILFQDRKNNESYSDISKKVFNEFVVSEMISEEQTPVLQLDLTSITIGTLQNGGAIGSIDICDFENKESFFKAISEKRLKQRENYIKKTWEKGRVARMLYRELPVKKKDRKIVDKKEAAFNVIDEYYDNSITEKKVKEQFIVIRERNYGNDKRIGISIKSQPYANQYTFIIRGIIGPYNVCNEGSGWDLELERGAELFQIIKHYDYFPTKDEIIDDICIYDLLEKLEPVAYIQTDISRIPIYPSAKQFQSLENLKTILFKKEQNIEKELWN